MKTNFFMVLICTCFLSIQGIFAQTTMNFSFKIWKNSMTPANELGTFMGTATTAAGGSTTVTTSPMLDQLCPGDQLIIRQNCYRNGSQHNFNTSNWATIALTNSIGFGVNSDPLATVYSGPIVTGATNYTSWAWNTTLTVTIPSNPSYDNYLAIGNNIFGNTVCGLAAFIPINIAPTTSIADQTICPDDAVTIPTVSGFSYANWSPNNPNITTPTTTTDYTVEITHATGCTQTDTFTIFVSNPEVDLSLRGPLCYNESLLFRQADYDALINGPNGTTTPLSLTANGTTIFDFNGNIVDIPHVINAATYGTGTITFQYTYMENGITCSKNYDLVIQPQIVLNTQSTYAFCNSNFQPIFATSNGILGQPGISYTWTQAGATVGTGTYFIPSAYGTYQVHAYDEAGCEVSRSFTVYDPGVGIKHPANISFCSLTQPAPSYIGWSSDPFGPIDYSFDWTYTDLSGVTVAIPNTGPQYQVPYQGLGTYTVLINANGCTETISIVVSDLAQVYNNHSNANFSFSPLGGNEVSCQPTTSMLGTTELWTVVNLSTNLQVPTTAHSAGIKFSYATGVQYSVTFRRLDARGCKEYNNQFTWLDGFEKDVVRQSISNDTKSSTSKATATIYPNPTRAFVNIPFEDIENSSNIKVVNNLGQVILEKEVQGQITTTIDLSNYNSGLYIIQITTGEEQRIEKVIKE